MLQYMHARMQACMCVVNLFHLFFLLSIVISVALIHQSSCQQVAIFISFHQQQQHQQSNTMNLMMTIISWNCG